MALPTADEAFGPRALPTADEAFPPPPPRVNTNAVALGGADMDEHFSQGSVGQLLDWFGKGAQQGWGTKPLGLDPETDAFLKKYAPDYGVVGRAFHDEIVRPAAAALDFAMRAPGAVAHGIYEVAPVVGGPLLAGMEAFPAGHLTGFPANVPTPQAFARAADLGVIGKGEAGFQDTTDYGPAARNAAIEALTPGEAGPPVPLRASASGTATAEFSPTLEASATLPPLDVHAVAREIAPDTFAEYDALTARRDTFQRHLAELSDSRANGEQAQALQGRIDNILGKVNGVEDRLTKAAAARLEAARTELDGFLRTDTPEMARVRQELQKNDFARRDLAPDVSAAYRQAAEQMPKADAEPVAPQPAAEAAQAPEAVPAPEIAPKPEPAAPAPAGEPPLAKGMVRLYRGETDLPSDAAVPDWLKDNPEFKGTVDATGRWFSASREEAEHYNAVHGAANGRISFVDVPADAAKNWLSSARPEVARFSAAGRADEEYFLPREIADRRKPIAPAAEPPKPPAAPLEGGIAGDVTRQLVTAGRPAEEAQAAAALVQAHYEARAERFGGTKGTAEDLYRAEAPNVRAGRGVRALELAQKGELGQPLAPKTAAFRDWFGESKAVDAAGEPRRLYHGTTGDVAEFDPRKMGFATGAESAKKGFFFTSDPEVASSYAVGSTPYHDGFLGFVNKLTGGLYEKANEAILKAAGVESPVRHGENVVPVYVRIENPLEINFRGQEYREQTYADLITLAKKDGHDGVIFRNTIDPGFKGGESPSDVYAVFDPKQIKSAIGNRGTFERDNPRLLEQTRRGKIRLATDDAKATITLFKDADASTFIHETGHHWLEELVRDAADERAPPDLTADAATVRQWLGVEDGADIPTRAHEKFARGFERYMMEGHAPSAKLAEVFAKFRDWLTRIYETVAGLRSPINDEIRGVFDRMLASKNEGEAVVAPERAEPATAPSPPGREFGPTAVPKSRSAIYEPVPTEPRRLVDFLRREGGLRDDGGEISHIIGGKNRRPGLINGKGKSLDDAALRAWEEGYFPEHGANRPTINDLLDAIREDVSGNAQYSHKDRAMVEAFRGAMDRNAEIDRLGEQMGINPRDYTREQFWDMAAEHLSRERQAREIGSLDAAAELDFAEAERRAKEHIESRGDAWEPDALYGIDEPRTLEDMENAYKSEGAALGNAPEGQSGAVEPGSAAGVAGSIQDGIRQGGRGAGSSGRAGAGAGEAPAGAHGLFGPASDGLVDKAGNIRLDNLKIPDDVAQAIRDAAEQNGGFITARRGVISDAEALSLADALGMDAAKLNRRKLGEAFNEEKIIAARKLLIRSATEVRDAMARAASGSDADVLAYVQSKARHLMIQEQVSGITAEAGRALRAFRALEGSRDAEMLREFFQQQTGRTLDQMRREAQLGLNLDTPQQVSRFVQDSEKPTWKDYLVEAWINALLSGPKTHIKNLIGNAAVAVNSIAETGLAAGIGEIRQRLIPGVAAERVQFREVGARLFGLVQGAHDGVIAAGKAMRDENYVPAGARQVEQYRHQAIPSVKVNVAGIEMELGGKQVRLPSRMLMAEDEFFKAVATRQELNAIAYRAAMDEGLTGDAFTARVADLVEHPSDAMVEQARKFAEYQTFTNSLGRAGSAIQTFANAHLPLKLIFPFIRTPLNLLKYANERTPLGLFSKQVRENLSTPGVARDTQIARMALGTTVATAVTGLVLNNLVTGGGPSNPSEKAAMRLAGWRPYSTRVGDFYYDYNWLDPLSTIMGVTADLTDAVRSGLADDAEVDKIAGALIASISKNILSKASLRGASDLVQALTDADRYGPKYLQNLAGTVVPSVIAQSAAAEDPLLRDARTMLDAIKARIPGARETVLPKRDIWGEPMPNQGALGPDLLSPIMQGKINNDPVNRALVELKFSPAPVRQTIRDVQLTPQQYDDYARESGRLAKMQLDALVGPGFSQMPAENRRKLITATVEHARELVATKIMMQSVGSANDIMQKAMDSKVSGLQGATHEHVKELLKVR